MTLETVALWGGFTALVAVLLAVDLVFVSRGHHEMTVRNALIWSALWISAGLTFGLGIFVIEGSDTGLKYLTGYVIEKSLGVDNLFVFLVIFTYFGVPKDVQPKALTMGIIGALIMRFFFIIGGSALLNTFHWIIFIFGFILIFTAYRLATSHDSEVHPDRNVAIRVLRRFMPITPQYHGTNLFVKIGGQRLATPFLVTLIVLATTDLVFAVDSIPAIFAITTDPFIVYTSNAFAILGMRALFFALAGVMGYFVYLRHALVAILFFVGSKMLISEWYHVPVPISLGFVLGTLAIAVIASLLVRKKVEEEIAPEEHPIEAAGDAVGVQADPEVEDASEVTSRG